MIEVSTLARPEKRRQSILTTTINGRTHFLSAKPNCRFGGNVAESELIEREVLRRLINDVMKPLLSDRDFDISCREDGCTNRHIHDNSRIIFEASQNICWLIQMISNEFDRLSRMSTTAKKLRHQSFVWMDIADIINGTGKYASLEDVGFYNDILQGSHFICQFY